MSSRRRRRCHSLSDDSEEANGNHADAGPEPEPEELDWDSYSTTLEHRLAAVGILLLVCNYRLWSLLTYYYYLLTIQQNYW